MGYRIRVGRAAKREALALPGYVRQRVLRIIDALADEPRPPAAKELRDRPGYYRIRVARWRIIYQIGDNDGLVSIITVRLKTGPETYENLLGDCAARPARSLIPCVISATLHSRPGSPGAPPPGRGPARS